MESQELDLLPAGQKNDIFLVTFDYYTPRAHFILVPKDDSLEIKPEHHFHLIEAAKSMLSVYGISNGILSIHRGSWKSTSDKTSRFHFHLCVDVEKYLSVFEEKKSEIPGWPDKQYVNSQWKASKNPSSYAVNVRGYPYRSYFKEEVAAINAFCKPQSTNESDHVPKVPSGMEIVYHPSQPKIGFLWKRANSTEDLQQVLRVLEEFAEHYGLTNSGSRNDNEGCHLCLYLGDPETSDWNITQDTSAVGVVGYIVTTGTRFHQLCPPEQRASWFEAFKVSNFECKT